MPNQNKNHHQSKSASKNDQTVKNIGIVFILNLVFSGLEFIFGFIFNSSAILSDAVHDLGDSVSVGLAFFFQKYSTKKSNDKFSFGYQRFSLLGALITAVVLLAGSILVAFRSVPLLFDPQPVNSSGMLWISIFAIVVNGYAAWLMSKGKSENESFLNLHMLEDVLGWIGVLVVSIIMQFSNLYILDPMLSIGIALYIFVQAVPKFYHTLTIFLESVPEGVDLNELESNILTIEEIDDFSHFHFWSIDGQENAFSVTLLVSSEHMKDASKIKAQVREQLEGYNVTHSTIELVTEKKDLRKHN
ncbi:cation diffusion facilitator family transporter [Marinilactibacillus psychrotolerans]|uniref:Cation transporter n=1 Tax=Marinilactibacillus psychrotolerans TaxID=191770 RepID=A0AAV3WRM0_9LACT|nr:cation diffusion facilitator family transporter [Marinilactibacillus psychrotolerans]GEL66758.1 cation transporter [Marinilactibacillus psychrotolerans]GEQ35795.1 cation transporter [Marinilactibacillus psychrotolerans]SDC33106.1 cobalt-zinc-cadmium efflux system protein [Marinilactibacillus psychrotolerans]